jgi:tetratricopeptide (TPR) repeat protein
MTIDFTTRDGRKAQGRLIQQAAEEAGLSLEALAREIECSRALIYQYVSGATLAQPDRIQLIAQRTGKPLLFFYGGEAMPDNLHERVQGLQTLLAAQLAPPDPTSALSTAEQLIALARQAGDIQVEAGARLKLVSVLLGRGEASRALALIDGSRPFFRQHGLTSYLNALEQDRGHALLALGRIEEAEAAFAITAANPEWRARWQGTVSLAAVAEHRGQYRRALELLDDTAALERTAPDARAALTLRLYVAGNLANINLACGDLTDAMRAAETARDLAEQLANRDQYTESLLTLGTCYRLRGALALSRETLEAAERWARLTDDRGREAMALAELAQTLVEAGRFEDARARGKDALQRGIASGTRRAELAAQLALASAYLRSGQPQEARYHAGQAWEISTLQVQPYAQATALVALGEAHAARGETTEARSAFQPAADLAESIGARVPAVYAALGLIALGDPPPTMLAARTQELASPLLSWRVALALGNSTDDADAYRAAIDTLGGLRAALADEPMGDTYLEDRVAWEPYLRLARLLRAQGRGADADAVLADAEWPPLLAVEDVAP